MRDLECPQHASGEQVMRRQAGDVLTIEKHPSRCGGMKARNDIEQGRLAGTVRADQAGDRSRRDRQRDIVDSLDASKMLGQVFNDDHAAPAQASERTDIQDRHA